MQFSVIVPRMDLMQVLEDEGATAATGPPSSASSAESDSPNPSIPLGIGIGVGGFGTGGEDEPGESWGRREVPH